MVRRLVRLLGKEVRGLHETAYLLGAFAFFSQLLALVRDRIFAATFGAGEILDAYYAAFRIPDFLFVAVASFASLYVLLPLLSEKTVRGREEARGFLSSVFTVVFSLLAALSLLAFVFADGLVAVLYRDLGAAAHAQVTLLVRIMLLQPLLLGFSNLLASVTQMRGRFLLYALSPLLYNLGIIAGVLWLYPWWGIAGLGWGVVLGALLHVAIQVPFVMREGMFPTFAFRVQWRPLAKVGRLSLPRTLALSMSQLVFLLFTALAAGIGAGAIAVLQFSYNLLSVPLAIVGVSYSVAAFPMLSRLYVDGKRNQFCAQIFTALRHVLFWTIPIAVLVVVLRAQIVRVVLGSGAFDWTDTRLTAAALALFILSLPAQAMVLLLVRGLYAAGNTRIPLLAGSIAAVVAIFSALGFQELWGGSSGMRGTLEYLLRVEGLPGVRVLLLPLAFSIGALVNAGILASYFAAHFGARSHALAPATTALRSFAAALLGGAAGYLLLGVMDDVVDINTFFGIFTQGLVAGLGGVAVTVGALFLLKSQEVAEASRALSGKLWRQKPILPEPES